LNVVNLSNVTITDTSFTGNQAVQSACLYISDSSTVTSSNCQFTGNTASISAVFTILLSGKLIDTGSTITGNKATSENSVGLFTDTTGSSFDGTIITDNTMTVGASK
jgi:hypothetical protein